MMQFLAVAVFTSKREQPDIYESKRTTEKKKKSDFKKSQYWNHLVRFHELQLVSSLKITLFFFSEIHCSAYEFCIDPIILRLPTLIFYSFSKFPCSFKLKEISVHWYSLYEFCLVLNLKVSELESQLTQ